MTPFDISVTELKAWIEAGKKFQLIDVREPFEHTASAIAGDLLIPMGDFLARQQELEPDTEIVLYCRSGNRSGQVVSYMRQHGFPDMRNLTGGILEWERTFGKI